MKSRVVAAVQLSVLALGTGCVGELTGEEAVEGTDTTGFEQVQDPLNVLNTVLWPKTPLGYASPAVCWEQSTGFDSEKAWARDSISETWGLESQLRVISWGNCTAPSKGLRINWHDAGGVAHGLGTQLDGDVNGVEFNTWASGNGNCVTGWSRERCVRSTAVHEFGHALGFAHEQNRTDTPSTCKPCTSSAQCSSNESCVSGHCVQGTNGNQTIGAWDAASVLNYCNPVRNGDSRLSGTDIEGMVTLYGHPTPVTAASWGANTMAAFIRGPSNALYEAYTNDGTNWSAFFTQDGVLTSAPSVVSWGSNRLDVVARGTDGAVWQKYWASATGWSGWNSLGGTIKGKPEIIARAANRLDVFARWTDDTLRVRSWNGSAWSAWTSLGDDVVGEPAITSWGSNRLDVLVRSRDGNLRHRSWNGTSWAAWTNLGGGDLDSSPSAASWGANRLDVVVRRSNQNLWHRAWNGTSWSAWADLGQWHLGNPKITARTANILDIFVRGTDNAVWQRSWTGSSWTSWWSHGGFIKGTPEVATPNANKVEIVAQGSDDTVWRKTWNGSGWGNWTQIGGLVR